MTEQEWLAHEDPVPMLEFVDSPANERKLRLFLCACCARVLDGAARWGHITAAGRQMGSLARVRSALWTVEEFADGLCGRKELASARRVAEDAVDVPASIDYGGETGLDGEARAVCGAAARRMTPESVMDAYRQVLATLRYHLHLCTYRAADASPPPLAEQQRDMARWLRDVVGNPFRPVAVDPAWLSRCDGNVVRLAESIYASRRFDELPILADALEDAGCADAAILGHCREPGSHVRGCWVLDLFLEAPKRFALAAAPPEAEESSPVAVAPPPPAPPPPQWRPGDWRCPGCNAHNFARRQSCHQCKGARPS